MDTLVSTASLIARSTWAARPSAVTAAANAQLLVTDIPSGGAGTVFTSDGTRWVKAEWVWIAGSSAAGAAHTGTLTKTTVASFTLPDGLLGSNGMLVVSFRATVNNSVNAKLVNVVLGGTDLFNSAPVSQTYQGGTARISNRNSQASQIGTPLNLSFVDQNGVNALMTGTVDTSIAQTVGIAFTLANIADTMTLETWEAFFVSRG